MYTAFEATDIGHGALSWAGTRSGLPRVLGAWAAAVWLALLPLVASGNELRGRVVAVADGDTVTVLEAGRVQHKVRLNGIDAPEREQPFGNASQRSLSALVYWKDVVVAWHKADRYGRLVGVVRVEPSGEDVGLTQVRRGLAWHYKAYDREQSAAERELYSDAEIDARDTRRGLWRDQWPVAPWDYRKARSAIR